MRPGILVGPQGFGGTHLLKGCCPSFHSLSVFSVPNVLLIRSCLQTSKSCVDWGSLLWALSWPLSWPLSPASTPFTSSTASLLSLLSTLVGLVGLGLCQAQLLVLHLFLGKLQLLTVKSVNQQVLSRRCCSQASLETCFPSLGCSPSPFSWSVSGWKASVIYQLQRNSLPRSLMLLMELGRSSLLFAGGICCLALGCRGHCLRLWNIGRRTHRAFQVHVYLVDAGQLL